MAADDESAGQALQQQTLDRYTATKEPDFPDAVMAAAGKRFDADFDPPPI
jgi:hypothetical protein